VTWYDINALILRILARWWVVLLIAALVVGAAAWRVSGTQEQYRATVLMVVGPNIDMEPSEVLRVADLLNRDTLMATYADVYSSPRVVNGAMQQVSDETSSRVTWPEYTVRVVREPGSNVLRMIVEGPDQARVGVLADATRLQGEAVLNELFPIYSITTLTSGPAWAEPVGLPWTRAIAISLVIGMGFGILVALWFDSLLQYRQSAGSPTLPGTPRAPTTEEVGAAGQQVVTQRRQ
jgi:capsular polysaccharide biosynthesis protein